MGPSRPPASTTAKRADFSEMPKIEVKYAHLVNDIHVSVSSEINMLPGLLIFAKCRQTGWLHMVCIWFIH